jgi:hypothetical protein
VIARRAALLGGSAAALGLFWAGPAHAGSYLHRAAFLVSGARREADTMRIRFGDKELARIAYKLAHARLEAASTMMVPKEVVQAHPHLLLTLENYERAADAAVNGEGERFMIYCHRAQDEERTFRAILRQLGWELPDGKGRPS